MLNSVLKRSLCCTFNASKATSTNFLFELQIACSLYRLNGCKTCGGSFINNNLAIANRSRVSCTHNTSRECIGLITPWVIYDYFRDLEMWVKGQSMSLKMVPFESLGTISYTPSIVTMAVSLAISEIFSVKEWPDLEIWVWFKVTENGAVR